MHQKDGIVNVSWVGQDTKVFKSWDELCFFMVCKLDGCVHDGAQSAHGCYLFFSQNVLPNWKVRFVMMILMPCTIAVIGKLGGSCCWCLVSHFLGFGCCVGC